MTAKKPELPIIPFSSREAWEAWLERQHMTTPGGVWLKIAKKGSGIERQLRSSGRSRPLLRLDRGPGA